MYMFAFSGKMQLVNSIGIIEEGCSTLSCLYVYRNKSGVKKKHSSTV